MFAGIETPIRKWRKLAASALLAAMMAACVAPANVPAPSPVTRSSNVPAQTQPRQTPTYQAPPPARPEYHNAIGADLENYINEQWRAFPGKTGIAVQRIDGDGIVGERLDDLFPQQSVSKLWVTMTVLDLVDRGELRLDQQVRISLDDLAVFHQPIRDRVIANGTISESIQSLMEQAITHSDNTANDSLLRTAGGPDAVNRFIREKNLGAIRFGPGERLLQSGIAGLEWRQEYSLGRRFYAAREQIPFSQRQTALNRYLADPVDGASPRALVGALAKLSRGELLSASSTRLLTNLLSRTASGPNRLKAGVPAGWQFGHKTGTGQVLGSVSTGYNDIGIMTAPDGTRYAVAVMLGDTTASIPSRMQLMQSITRAVARYHGQ